MTGLAENLFRSGFVCLVGPANSGKSTLLNAILGQKVSIVSPKPQTTRNRIVGVKSFPAAQLVLFDTPGFFRKRSAPGAVKGELASFLLQSMRDAASEGDFVLLVLDASELLRLGEALPPMAELLRDEQIRMPELIVLNKVDLTEKERLLPLLAQLYTEFSEAAGKPVEVIPVSALGGDGVAILEERIIERLPFGPRYFPEEYVTDQTEQLLAQEIIREKLFLLLGQEVPYSTAVQVEEWKEKDELLTIRATIFVERASQRGIIIGKGGQRLREIGSRARAELEDIFGTHIFLDLFIKVEEHWSESAKGLQRIGLLK